MDQQDSVPLDGRKDYARARDLTQSHPPSIPRHQTTPGPTTDHAAVSAAARSWR